MGSKTSANVEYGVWTGEKKVETRILRNSESVKKNFIRSFDLTSLRLIKRYIL